MTTYNTRNSVPSADPRDLHDNAKNMDEAVNSSADTFQDRLGKNRLTWTGIEKAGTGNPAIAVDAAARAADAAGRAADAAGRAENAEAMVDAANIKAEVDRAEAARDAAFVNADVYPDVATGRAAVADGEQFQVISPDGMEIIRYRRDSGTTQTEVARLPSTNGVRTGKAVGPDAIAPWQTSFARGGGGINLFDGKFYSLHMRAQPPYDVISGAGIAAVVRLEPGTQYTFSKSPDADRFRFGFFEEFPVAGAVPVAEAHASGVGGVDALSSYTHVAGPNERYALVALSASTTNHEPEWFQAEVGDSPTEYIPPNSLLIDLSKKSIPLIDPDMTSFFEKGKNLFDGKYRPGALQGGSPYELLTGVGGLYAVVPVSAGTTYTISKAPGTDRFRFGCFSEFPQPGSIPTSYYEADTVDEFTLTTDPDTEYLVVVPTSQAMSQAPRWLQVEVGAESTRYEAPFAIKPEITSFFEEGKNLFDGKYRPGALAGNPPYELLTGVGGLHAVVPVSAGTEYTISKAPGTDRFRFGCFSEFPQADSEPTSYYVADTVDEFTLTTDPDTKYLVVVPTSYAQSQAPEWLQVEVGASATRYVGPYTIKPEMIPAEVAAQRKRPDVVISGDFDAPYDPITPAPVMDSSLNLAVVYAWFDDLVDRFPDLWSRSLLVTETSGLPVYRYDFIPPVTRNILSESLPKILHVIGIHPERQALGSGMRFYKDLTDNWRSSALLEIFRWNVHFIVIPAFNAYGVENNTRGNANGVNLNRNFPNNWTFSDVLYDASGPEPLSEPEAAAMMELLETEQNIIFAIDHHNDNPYSSYPPEEARTIWTGTKSASVNKYLSGWSRGVQGMFAKKHPELAQGNISRITVQEAYIRASAGYLGFSFIDCGIPGTIFEISRDSPLSDFHTSVLANLFGFALKELHADKTKWFE